MKEISHGIQFKVDTVVKLVSCIFFLGMSYFLFICHIEKYGNHSLFSLHIIYYITHNFWS